MPATVALVLLLVSGSVGLGLHVPLGSFRAGNTRAAGLDYSRGQITEYGQLSDSFVESVVGRLAGQPGGLAALSTSDRAGSVLSRSFAVGKGPVVVTHPLTNDTIEHAYPVSGLPFTAHTNSKSARREPNSPGSCSPVGGTIWYRYTPPANLGLATNSFGTDHTVSLGVFSGRPSSLTPVGCDTDARGNAAVAFAALSGKTYYFQLTSPTGGGPTTFALGLQGKTTRISLSDDPSQVAVAGGISGDGRWLGFSAIQPPSDANGHGCVGVAALIPFAPPQICQLRSYLYDRRTRKIIPVSVSSTGELSNDFALAAGVSDDGRYVTLVSTATNLVPGDTNTCGPSFFIPGSCPDVFVHDRITGKTVRVSVSSSGVQGNGVSWLGQMSGDGRYVSWGGDATNQSEEPDTNNARDVFVHDRDADANGVFDEPGRGKTRTIRASVADDGSQANNDHSDALPFDSPGSEQWALSRNGRYVIFRSSASNLVRGDHNHAFDVFVRDIIAGRTIRVSVSSTGTEANGDTLFPSSNRAVTDNGRYAVFASTATNLVPGDTNGAEDVFVRDTVRGTTRRVTVASDGSQAAGEGRAAGEIVSDAANIGALLYFGVSQSPLTYFMAADGRFVFFGSGATNLVANDNNGTRDVFLRDLVHDTTTRVSVSTAGNEGNGSSLFPTASNDGRTITFESEATNLVDGEESQPGPLNEAYVRELP